MLTAVLLDLDGTLLDTLDDFVYVINILRENEGMDKVSRAQLTPYISSGMRSMILATFDTTEESPKYKDYFQTALELYQENLGENARIYPGLEDCIKDLQNNTLKWGIVTNKYARFAMPLLSKMNLQPDVLVCPDHVKRSKPAPDPLLHACALLNCSAENALYVGDHERDIECGKSAGSTTAVANWGYLDTVKSASWGADYVLERPTELHKLIHQLSAH